MKNWVFAMRCGGIHIVARILLLFLGWGGKSIYAQQWTWGAVADANVSIHQAAMATDQQGNIFVTGSFRGIASFSPTIQITSNGSESDIFVAKYNANGQAVWAMAAGMTGEDAGTDILLDDQGNIYLTGFYTDSLRLPASTSLVTGLGLKGLFLAKIDTGSRQAVWLSGSTGAGNAKGESICRIADDIYVCGEFESNCVFGGINRLSIGKLDVCVGRVDGNAGTWIWANSGGSALDDYAYSICSDSFDIYIAGAYAPSNFSLGTTSLSAGTNVNGFASKLDATGMAIWSAPIVGNSFDVGAKSICAGNQRIYLAGSLAGPDMVSFGNAPLLSRSTSKINENFWITALRGPDGSPVWATIEGGSGSDIVSNLILLDPSRLGIVGSIDQAITLGPSNLPATDDEPFLYLVDANLGSGISALAGSGLGDDIANDLASDGGCGILLIGDFTTSLTLGSLPSLNAATTSAGFLAEYMSAGGNLQTTLSTQYDTICRGDSSTLSISGIFDFVDWYVSIDSGQTWSATPFSNTPSIIVSPVQSTVYLAVTTLACEVNQDTAWVTVLMPPTVAILGLPDSVCTTAPTLTCSVSPNIPLGTIGILSLAFRDLGNGLVQFDPSLASTTVPSVLSYTYTDYNGCSNSTTDSVKAINPIALQISGIDTSYCASDTGTYLFTGNLSPLGQLSSSCNCLQINGAQASFSPAAATPGQTIQIDYSYANGCNNSVGYQILVYSPTAPVLSGLDSSYCFSAALDTVVSPWPNCSFSAGSWLQDLGNGVAVIDLNALQNRDTLLGMDYVGIDGRGCEASAQFLLQFLASPIPIVGPQDSICTGDSILLGGQWQSNLTYQWFDQQRNIISTNSQVLVSPAASANFLLNVTNVGGCSGRDSVNIFVFPSPFADAGPDWNICQGDTITLGSPASAGASYAWSSNLGFTCPLAQVQVSPSTSEKFQLQVQDSLGRCLKMDEVIVTVTAPVTNVDAGPDQNILGSATVLAALLPSQGTAYWQSQGAQAQLSDIRDPNASLTGLQPGTYQIDWLVENAPCPLQKDSVLIVVQAAFYPTGFSPNGDGVNDLLVFRGLELQPDNHLQVFNRWGNLVYDQIGYANEWDGTLNGQPIVDDTYYYVLKIQGLPPYSSYLVLARAAQN